MITHYIIIAISLLVMALSRLCQIYSSDAKNVAHSNLQIDLKFPASELLLAASNVTFQEVQYTVVPNNASEPEECTKNMPQITKKPFVMFGLF